MLFTPYTARVRWREDSTAVRRICPRGSGVMQRRHRSGVFAPGTGTDSRQVLYCVKPVIDRQGGGAGPLCMRACTTLYDMRACKVDRLHVIRMEILCLNNV